MKNYNNLVYQIAEQALQAPEQIAIEYGSEVITYVKLIQITKQIANFFSKLTTPASKVVLLLDNSPELIYAILGVMTAGDIFAPLNITFPPARISMIMKQLATSWAICDKKYLFLLNEVATLLGEKLQVLVFETVRAEDFPNLELYWIDQSVTAEREFTAKITTKNLYLYFTSGSTGRPKGVLGRHRSLAHFIDWQMKEFKVDQTFRVSQFTAPSFDASLRDIFLPLCAGGTVCIPEDLEIFLNPKLKAEWLAKHRITLTHMVPTLFRDLMQYIDRIEDYLYLRYIFLAGEMLRGKDLAKFFDVFKGKVELVNLYGATETTLIKFFYRVTPNDLQKTVIPVGQGITDTQALILKKDLSLCQLGEIGEIYIRTPFITSGYLEQPELTKQVFCKNPFSTNLQDIIYKTGDLGRFLADGNLEVMGRIDKQIKIRGIRIETEEIESIILENPEIKEVVVVACEEKEDDSFLCAYYTGSERITKEILRRELEKKLPDYMIPSYFVYLTVLPCLTNGKLDRQALPQPKTVLDLTKTYIAPQNEIEAKLQRIWQETLGIEKIGTNENFFEIGGDSLKAVKIAAEATKQAISISTVDVFKLRTIIKLAEYVATKAKSKKDKTLVLGQTGSLKEEKLISVKKIEVESSSLELPICLQERITTYLHRSLPLCIFMAYPQFLSWYYSHFIQIFANTLSDGLVELNYLETFDCYQDLADVICLGYNLLPEQEIKSFIKGKIKLGYYLIMNVDEYYLFSKSRYQQSHFVHPSLIYGYDDVNNQFLAIGFDDSQILSKLSYGDQELEDAYLGGRTSYSESAPWAEWSAVQLIKPYLIHKQDYPFTLEHFMEELKDYLYSRSNPHKTYLMRLNESKLTYGFEVYEVFIDNLKKILLGQTKIDYRAIHLLYEHKKVILERLQYILDKFNISGLLESLVAEYAIVVTDFNLLRIKYLECKYGELKLNDLEGKINNYIKEIKKMKEREYSLLVRIYWELSLLKKRVASCLSEG